MSACCSGFTPISTLSTLGPLAAGGCGGTAGCCGAASGCAAASSGCAAASPLALAAADCSTADGDAAAAASAAAAAASAAAARSAGVAVGCSRRRTLKVSRTYRCRPASSAATASGSVSTLSRRIAWVASAGRGHETHYKHVDTQCDDEHSHESSDMRCLSRVPAEQLSIQDGRSQMHVQGQQAVYQCSLPAWAAHRQPPAALRRAPACPAAPPLRCRC